MNDLNHIFITAALPYANGMLHFGHLAGVYLPADIYYRHCKLVQKKVVFICGSDEHGVAITLKANKEGKPYKDYVDCYFEQHKKIFSALNICFDYYGRTTSQKHKELAQKFFLELKGKGKLKQKELPQPYCNTCKKFLADRYISGECRYCGYKEARGDECPECGKWLAFQDLLNCKCQICQGMDIIQKNDRQWYLDLPSFSEHLQGWLDSKKDWKPYVVNFAKSLIAAGLPERAITRDLDWGIDVPGEKSGKKLYVWFEAPIGYLTFLMEYFDSLNRPADYKNFWSKNSELIHFIGKDNIVFHTIVWPAILMGADSEVLPTNVPANMYVLLNDKQFSKSQGITLDFFEWMGKHGEDKLRYYLSSIIPEKQDTSFNPDIFLQKANGELVDAIANYCHRIISFHLKRIGTTILPENFNTPICMGVVKIVNDSLSNMKMYLEKFEFRNAFAEIKGLADVANKFADDQKPWTLIKIDQNKSVQILAACVIYILGIGCLLQPFLPNYSKTINKAFPEIDFSLIYNNGISPSLFTATLNIDPSISLVISK